MRRIVNYRPDLLAILILAAVLIAIVVPVSGEAAEVAALATKLAIALLFFLYGVRLSPQEAVKGLLHWRLHLTILAFTFLLFPLVGLALRPLSGVIGEQLYLGILFLTLVPSTVQSSVAFTSLAKGNIAASIVAASVSSLLGVFLTPLLVLALMSGVSQGNINIHGGTFVDIAIQLLLPFLVGQVVRCWGTIRELAASPLTKKVDQFSIALVVYVSFSESMVEGIWGRVDWITLVGLIIGSVVAVYAMLSASSFAARRLGFSYPDQVAIQFAGTKKSLASGLPMAAVMFSGGSVGMVILPLMIFHQVQLIICSMRASAYAAQCDNGLDVGASGVAPRTW